MLRRIGLLGIVMVGLGYGTGAARANPVMTGLGVAANYNVFVFGDNTQRGPDSEGAVAVGGNANFGSGYDPGSQVGTQAISLVVAGDYINTDRYIPGSVFVGGNAVIHNPSIGSSLSVNGNLTITGYGGVQGPITVGGSVLQIPSYYTPPTHATTPIPVDFAAAQAYLTAESRLLSSLAANGTTSITPWHAITLTGSNAGLNVFHLSGAELANAVSFDIFAASGSTVLVNIDGTADAMKNFAFNLHGVDRTHVLYNFSEATSLYINGIGVQGTILSPYAAIDFAGGNIDGTLIGRSITGAGEAHMHPFAGRIPSVPEPSSFVLVGFGVMFGGGYAMLRRRRAPAVS